jgi:AcrR family transcriptional regulator
MRRYVGAEKEPTNVTNTEPTAAGARTYHPGDLRAALLRAAEEELAERGLEGFTLRSTARRAGVSHAASAHHFGDVTGLLTEVAIGAFGRMAVVVQEEVDKAERGTVEHLVASAIGYVRFARENPALFGLMFRVERLHATGEPMRAAGRVAFGIAVDAVGAFFGREDPMADPVLARRVVGLWSQAHGFATLLLAQQFGPPEEGETLTRLLMADTVREMFGAASVSGAREHETIRAAPPVAHLRPSISEASSED